MVWGIQFRDSLYKMGSVFRFLTDTSLSVDPSSIVFLDEEISPVTVE